MAQCSRCLNQTVVFFAATMDTLKIALETGFVGVLAIFWVMLIIQFFFPQAKDWFQQLPAIGADQLRLTVAGVLVAAIVYCLGAAVSRLGQDFFNDDDLLVSVTEDRIRLSVYCNQMDYGLVEAAVPFADESGKYSAVTSKWFHNLCEHDRPSARERIRQIFQLQESALLLAGTDKTSRLRLLHQQIMVLRGAAFDGVLTCGLFLIGWNLQGQRWVRWRFVLPLAMIMAALGMLWLHFKFHPMFLFQQPLQALQIDADDPPFMELTLLLLGFGGWYLLRRGAQTTWNYSVGFLAALLPTALVYAGWYWTEILYDRLVLYSFYAESHGLLKLVQ
jgi:hypothetical protein